MMTIIIMIAGTVMLQGCSAHWCYYLLPSHALHDDRSDRKSATETMAIPVTDAGRPTVTMGYLLWVCVLRVRAPLWLCSRFCDGYGYRPSHARTGGERTKQYLLLLQSSPIIISKWGANNNLRSNHLRT